jgi:hypothetical protein
MGGESVQELWVTQDLTVDAAAWRDMHSALMSANPVHFRDDRGAEEGRGVPVLVERTQKMMNSEVKSTETLVSAEEKGAGGGPVRPAPGLHREALRSDGEDRAHGRTGRRPH